MRLLLALLLAALALALGACGGEEQQRISFLDRYVADDGRVVRHDQGGDTVSEGQAYGMLLAVAERDEERFERVWTWTREHLRRPDGLLAWHWEDGRVTDDQAATDADLDAARALMLAAKRFDDPRYAEDGRALGRAVSEHETEQSVLVAGPWTQDVVNPSYWSPRAFAAIERVDLNVPARRLIGRRSRTGARCPPARRRAATPSTPTTPYGCRSASPSRAMRRTARWRPACGRGYATTRARRAARWTARR
jgi:endoglucanase